MLLILTIIVLGLAASLQLELLARPACPGMARPVPAIALHAGLFLVALAVPLAVSQRPLFSAGLVLAGQFLVIQVSNAKHRALREPFIFSDFGIFSQTIKHPRLYLPFLGLGRALLAGLFAAGAIGAGLWFEHPTPHFLAWAGFLAGVGLSTIAGGMATAAAPSLDPGMDIARHGLFASIAQYWWREKTRAPLRETKLPIVGKGADLLPDVVVIQSESFFDPRADFPGIRDDVLGNWDEACAVANWRGKLSVPAWGANTMRPEFAFLTGIEPAALDIHRFNPYRRVARRPIRALPAVLREAGYTATCIHPHPARFFRRDRAFPNLGFGRFVDIRGFGNASKFGPYVSDEAVTDKLIDEMERGSGPSFYFVITMENHGPLHLESLHEREYGDYFRDSPPPSCRDLGVYLRHLKNADRQLGRLREFLHDRARPFVLVFYGEHLPSMPNVYDVLGTPDGRTDYFIEAPSMQEQRARDHSASDLAKTLCEVLEIQNI